MMTVQPFAPLTAYSTPYPDSLVRSGPNPPEALGQGLG